MKIVAILAILSVFACNKGPGCDNFLKVSKNHDMSWDEKKIIQALQSNSWKLVEECACEEVYPCVLTERSSENIEFNFVNDSTLEISKNKQLTNTIGFKMYKRFVEDNLYTILFETSVYNIMWNEYHVYVSKDGFTLSSQILPGLLFKRVIPN